MGDSPTKSTRELVTLPAELAKRIEAFRARVGHMSKSDSLKLLIEGGLRRYDTWDDLFARCQEASRSGQSLGDIIMQILVDHPLIASTTLDSSSLCAYLVKDDPEETEFRFRFSRSSNSWAWEYLADDYNQREWRERERPKAPPSDDDFSPPPGPRRPATRSKAELDDDIPF
ncbi:MAG: hypothetical protein J0J01_11015 [Reyranella sp.]|uniref:hypothetical protein n=1 Tax=Reyranella sp. TaxID=1929291 RepID=UPI001AC171F5|nr:hypothetical protein [Reyranella sp.]MBN9087428.1 hypothetical protein [Reyranella sp.]